MKSLRLRSAIDTTLLSRDALKLERRGEYEKALDLIAEGWAVPDSYLDLEGLDTRGCALLLLRFGSLIGFQGHRRNIAGWQDRSKDILMDARDRFSRLQDTEMIAACENYLALAYWRTGEFREADSFLSSALEHNLPASSDSRLYSHVIRSMILADSRRHAETVEYCRSFEADFRQYGDAFFNASLYANLGISLKDLNQIPEALSCLNIARAFHKRARHTVYVATVDNNLALLYKREGRFDKAHESVDSAVGIYKRLKDKPREGSSLETKAQIFLAERKYDLALATIEKSIAVLRKSENIAYLAESIMLRSRILLFLGDFASSVFSLVEAVNLSKQQSGEAQAKLFIEEFRETLEECRQKANPEISGESGEVELILPPNIDAAAKLRGIWINSANFESIGIPDGSLVVAIDKKADRGDLVAISENATNEVSCGFFDTAFGIICLETPGSEPSLYDENEISVVGKIVGVCRNARNTDGRLVVEQLNL